jgi:hypothetical protein
MELGALAIGLIVILIILFIFAKIIKSCLPKIIIGFIILGVLGYLAYWYFSR